MRPRILDHFTQELYIPAAPGVPPGLAPLYTGRGVEKQGKTPPYGREPDMRLSTKGRYAVMAMADLAGMPPTRNRANTAGVAGRHRRTARRFRCPIWSSSSPSCGAAAWSPACAGRAAAIACRARRGELRIADIILAVDEPIAATRCKTGSAKGCTETGARCVTHDLWEELGQQIHVFLSSVSLADVVERRVLGRTQPCNDVSSSETARSGAEPITRHALSGSQCDFAVAPGVAVAR